MINYLGSQVTFRTYGFLSLLVLALFILINFYKRDTGFQTNLDPSEDPRQMADEGGALAPHGVPASPMPRALSSSRLHEQDPGYGSTNYQAQDGTLAPPGGTNPFTAGGEQPGFPGGGGGGMQYRGNTDDKQQQSGMQYRGNTDEKQQQNGIQQGDGGSCRYNYATLKMANPFNPFLQQQSDEEKLRMDSLLTEKGRQDAQHDHSFVKRNFKEWNDTYNLQLREDMVVKAPEPAMVYHAPQPIQEADSYAW